MGHGSQRERKCNVCQSSCQDLCEPSSLHPAANQGERQPLGSGGGDHGPLREPESLSAEESANHSVGSWLGPYYRLDCIPP